MVSVLIESVRVFSTGDKIKTTAKTRAAPLKSCNPGENKSDLELLVNVALETTFTINSSGLFSSSKRMLIK